MNANSLQRKDTVHIDPSDELPRCASYNYSNTVADQRLTINTN